MKAFTIVLFLLPQFVFAQPNFSAVATALGKGDVATLSQYLDADVEIVMDDSDAHYAKTQAATIVKDFLTKHAPTGCTIAHSGNARDNGSYYCIGKLVAGGKNFRINIFFKEIGGKFLIQEMRFEED